MDEIMQAKLSALAALVEQQQIQRLIAEDLGCEANRIQARAHTHVGKKYARVDVGSSGHLMIDIATGEIFGIKGYGTPHRGRRYGTLDTIKEWYWGDYTPVKMQVGVDLGHPQKATNWGQA